MFPTSYAHTPGHACRLPVAGQAGARKAASAPAYIAGSLAPHSSRAECIDNIGAPKSTVVAPVSAAVIGPTVEPQGMSLRDTNCCTGTTAWSQAMMLSLI